MERSSRLGDYDFEILAPSHLAPDPSRDKLPPHPVLSRLPLEEMGTRGQPLLSPPRERSHVGGGSALGTGQSAQAGQARADVFHRRAIAGTQPRPFR